MTDKYYPVSESDLDLIWRLMSKDYPVIAGEIIYRTKGYQNINEIKQPIKK